MTKTILITGGCGFIGSHVVEHIHRKTNWNIVVIDKLSYASKGLARLRDADLLNSDRIRVMTYDLSHPLEIGMVQEIGPVNFIIHMAAESHVDNSIRTPIPFIKNNVMNTVHMLEYARTHLPDLEKFFYFSTDEVFGSVPENEPDFKGFKEWDRHRPTNPYSASKSAAEMICIAYENTYDTPMVITNLMNVFGERQHVEKFIPKCIKYIQEGKTIPIHAYPCKKKAGKRTYIHARNVAAAILFLIHKGEIGEKYNIRGERELDNLELAQFIANVMGKELKYDMVDFHSDRSGHDLRYELDSEKLEALGWRLPVDFDESLRNTVLWTIDHPLWLEE